MSIIKLRCYSSVNHQSSGQCQTTLDLLVDTFMAGVNQHSGHSGINHQSPGQCRTTLVLAVESFMTGVNQHSGHSQVSLYDWTTRCTHIILQFKWLEILLFSSFSFLQISTVYSLPDQSCLYCSFLEVQEINK